MSRYTFQDALPLAGSSAALVTAAIASSYPMQLPRLAKEAGISRFAAARAAEPARELGVLVEDDGLWEFNDDHELSQLLCQLAWRFSGVVRPPRRSAPSYWSDDRWNQAYRYRELIPASLQDPEDDDPSRNVPGPDLREARAFVDWGRDILGELHRFEAVGQEVYSLWHTERLRDLIHQTLHFGQPMSQAIQLMTRAAGASAQGAAAPHEVTVTARQWARATYLVAADAYDVAGVVLILDTAIRETVPMHAKRDDAMYMLETLAHAEPDSEHRGRWIDDAVKAAQEAEARWQADTDVPYKHIGGMPRPVDVGTAGDKIFAVELHRCAQRLVDKVTEMAAEPGFRAWQEFHPDEASRFPLIAKVPELKRQPRFAKS